MKIRYLGTAAAEGAPALFCTCDHCAYARKVGGKEIRSRAGSILDDRLKIDFGPDSFMQMIQNHIDYTPLKSILVTHSHSDHFCASDIGYRKPGFANLPENYPPVTIYGNAKVGEAIESHLSDLIQFQLVEPYQPFEVEGYTVTALDAVHCIDREGPSHEYPVTFRGNTYYRSERALIYLIEKDGKALLYGHDTDELDPRVFECLKGKKLDLVSLDCTNGVKITTYVGHMGVEKDLNMREKLLECGAADAHSIFVANHFSHNGLIPYEALEKAMPDFRISYDSMEIEF